MEIKLHVKQLVLIIVLAFLSVYQLMGNNFSALAFDDGTIVKEGNMLFISGGPNGSKVNSVLILQKNGSKTILSNCERDCAIDISDIPDLQFCVFVKFDNGEILEQAFH